MIRFVGFDIETIGDEAGYALQPHRVKQGKASVSAVSVIAENGDVLYSALNPATDILRNLFGTLAEDKDLRFIGWNTQFDVAWMVALGLEKEVRKLNWADGEVMRRMIDNTTDKSVSFGLKATVAKFLPEFAGYENEVAGNFEQVDETLLKYNKKDAFFTALLGRIFWEQLSREQKNLTEIISTGIVPFGKAWVEGIKGDVHALDIWEKQIEQDLLNGFEAIGFATDIEATPEILGSPIQLKKFLWANGVEVGSTNKTELSKFASVPLVKAILDYKEARTAATKFIAGLRASFSYNGLDTTHPSARLWNTYTGRIGYSSKTLKKLPTGVAIHQFPRKSEARNCICAPDGFQLVEWDFSTQESRLLCDFSGDPTLFKIFNEGYDFHTYLAAIIAEIDYENMLDRIEQKDAEAKESRLYAKIVNLSCAYRTSWKKLIDVGRAQFGVQLSEAKAQYLHGLFRTTYREVPVYWNNAISTAKARGYAETRGSRRVKIDSADWQINRWGSESTAINFPIQGTGADMKFLGLKYIDPLLYQNGGRYMLDLHDALFALVPDTSRGYDLALAGKEILSNLPYQKEFGWSPRVPMPVDMKIGKSWGSLKEVK